MTHLIYSVYKGDEEIAFGTIEEIAAKLKIKPESVKFYGTNVYKNRTTENARRLVKVD
ncbi:MAG: hypothetical protein RR968_08780 [Vagococcus sp.]